MSPNESYSKKISELETKLKKLKKKEAGTFPLSLFQHAPMTHLLWLAKCYNE